MFIRIKDKIINTNLITEINVYADGVSKVDGSPLHYLHVSYVGDDVKFHRVNFESEEQLQNFLGLIQINEID